MSAEDEGVLDVKVPTRRRRASDDEADEVEFHDAAEYAASVADSQGVDREDQVAEDAHSEDGYRVINDSGVVSAGDGEATGSEGNPSEHDQGDQLAAERKKAKLREPFEVPTSGAFWLHDDRFGGEELKPEAPKPSGPAERKARSDTEGRWLHDKFSTLELDDAAEDDLSENAFSQYRRGRGRGLRGSGRRGGISGGWSPSTPIARSRGGITVRGRSVVTARGRGGRPTSSSIDDHTSEPSQSEASLSQAQLHTQEALPQRPPRAPRAATRSAGSPPATVAENAGAEPAASSHPGAGRGRGSDAKGGRIREKAGRGRSERSISPELTRYRELGSSPGVGTGGRVRGPSGRGRGRDDASRSGGALGRGGYDRDAGRGYGRGVDADETGRALSSRGRGAGSSSTGDYQGRGPGTARGQPPTQRPQQAMLQQRKPERTIDEEFPPLPASSAPKKPAAASSLNADMPPGVASSVPAMDAVAHTTQGVRRYSKMAGKGTAATSGIGDANPRGSAAAAAVPEGGHARGVGTDNGPAARTSKLSAAAPTFEPSPAAAAAASSGKQPIAQQPAPPVPQQAQHPAPSVPAAFGAPLQPMTVVATTPPMGAATEQYGAGLQPLHGQSMPYLHPQQQPQAQAQPGPVGYGAPVQQQLAMAPQGMMTGGGSPMAPPQGVPYNSMGTLMYGASPAEVEAWYQDAYQKALAIGMDPQQAYSAVQGYVQGLKMAAAVVEHQRWQQQQQIGGYPGVPATQMQSPPAGPYEAAKSGLYEPPKGGAQGP